MRRSFEFTRGQKAGLIFWAGIILLILVFTRYFHSTASTYNLDADPSQFEYVQLSAKQDSGKTNSEYTPGNKLPKTIYKGPAFDPNSLDLNGWKNLGFSEKQAQAILSYRQKSGDFKVKQDLKKIYVISDQKYAELEPFILLPQAEKSIEQDTRLSLNSATVADLEALPLIGNKTAQRIVKYRKSLGGFVSMTQLHEVYGLTEEIYQILLDNTILNTDEIAKIRVNSDSKERIDAHPYIDFPCVALILKKRETESIQSLDFLIEAGVMSQETREKVEPYIEYE